MPWRLVRRGSDWRPCASAPGRVLPRSTKPRIANSRVTESTEKNTDQRTEMKPDSNCLARPARTDPSPSVSRYFTAGPRAQCPVDAGVHAIGQEAHRDVREQPVDAAGMVTPREMGDVAAAQGLAGGAPRCDAVVP